MFSKGHKINVGRKNPNAGRKPAIRKRIRAVFEELLPDCEAEVAKLALQSTNERVRLEACLYIRDCVKGRPHQSQDLRIKGELVFRAEDYALAIRQADIEEQKLLAEGRDGIQGQGEAEKLPEAVTPSIDADGNAIPDY